jgi:hypothetical protein
MDVVFAHHPFQHAHIQRVTRLAQQVSAAQLHVSCQHLVAVFCAPHQLHFQFVDSMAACSLLHPTKLPNA